MANAYEVLGIAPGIETAALKQRYSELLRQVHPDMNPDDPQAAAKTKRLVDAYEVLSDPSKRSALDSKLREEAEAKRRKQEEAARARREADRKRQAAEQRQKKATQQTTQQEREARGAARARARRRRRANAGISSHQEIHVGGTTIIGNGNVHITMNGRTVHSSSGTSQGRQGNVESGSGTLAGTYHGNVTIHPGSDTAIKGQVMGNVLVGSGSTVTIKGQVMGNVVVGTGSEVVIKGKVMGNVTAPGSNVSVHGVLMGNLTVGSGKAVVCGVHMGRVV